MAQKQLPPPERYISLTTQRAKADRPSALQITLEIDLTGTSIALSISRRYLETTDPPPQDVLGLVRSEYLFSAATTWPTFDEQIETYSLLFAKFKCQAARVRLFDLSREKHLWHPPGDSRGMSILVSHPNALETQCQALADSATSQSVELELVNAYAVSPSEVEPLYAFAKRASISTTLMLETAATIRAFNDFDRGYEAVTIGMNDLLSDLDSTGHGAPPAATGDLIDEVSRLLGSLRGDIQRRACVGAQMTDWASLLPTLGIAELIFSP